jgi:hypothetical protein
MAEDRSYNGWKNYETWCVVRWIDNEEAMQHEANEMGRRAGSQGELAQDLKDWIDEMAPALGATMWADLLNAALSEVNWSEIAEHYMPAEEEAQS